MINKNRNNMKETIEEEEKDFEIPDELKRKIIDIMNDCPDIRKLGDKEYKIYNHSADYAEHSVFRM